MALEYGALWLITIVILVLPWNQKHTGTWNKIKKWYGYLLSSLLIVLAAMALGYLPVAGDMLVLVDYIQWTIAVIAMILGGIGVLGMCKDLLSK